MQMDMVPRLCRQTDILYYSQLDGNCNEKSNPPAMLENGISGDGEDNKIKPPVI